MCELCMLLYIHHTLMEFWYVYSKNYRKSLQSCLQPGTPSCFFHFGYWVFSSWVKVKVIELQVDIESFWLCLVWFEVIRFESYSCPSRMSLHTHRPVFKKNKVRDRELHSNRPHPIGLYSFLPIPKKSPHYIILPVWELCWWQLIYGPQQFWYGYANSAH